MSISSNQGPVQPLQRHNRQNSLYTDNSDDSDDVLATQPKINLKIQQVVANHEVETKPKILPEIKSHKNSTKQIKNDQIFNSSFVNDSAERNANYNQKMSIDQREEIIPKLPVFTSQSKTISAHHYHNNQSLSRGKSNKRYGMEAYQFQPITKSFQLNEAPPLKPTDLNDRALRSSQGGRWIRSQSLMNQKEQRTTKYLIRHYHKHNSLMFEKICKFIEHFEDTERIFQGKPFKISLFDSLETIKTKMEVYLQRKMNLDNLVNERPTAEWSQEDLTQFYTKYQPILIKKEVQKKEFHPPITLKKYKNCVYFGSIHNGKKEGEGILHYFTGKFFEGYFKDDQKFQGLEIDDKELYFGEFKRGLRHGDGILKTMEALFVGTFHSGQFSTSFHKQDNGASSLMGMYNTVPSFSQKISKKGFQITHSTLKIYESNVTILKNNAGDIFIGSINENEQKNQEGLEIFANGDLYLGRYEAGSPEGYGEYYWEDGAHYRGQFLSGMRHGRGVWHMVNGDFYEGEYMNDKKNGKGTYIWKNGSKYIGSFENDYRHGYGEMYWQNGKVYKGKWSNGIQKGTVIKSDHNNSGVNPKLNSLNKSKFRTIQYDAHKRKIPLEKLKSIYNPSNNIN